MSTTSIKSSFGAAALPPGRETGNYGAGSAEHPEQLLKAFSFAGWRRPLLETLVFLAVIAALRYRFGGVAAIPGVPDPYWLPVLLASCQYGLRGGMIATIAASVVYWLGLPPASAAQDFYGYAGMVAVQPAAWLATALVVGGLRNLHISQATEVADQLEASRRCASDLSGGLERATAEVNALERRIAIDTSSVAALSRTLSLLDMSDRRAAAMSYGELFRVGTGAATFTIYLKDPGGYVPVWAVEEDAFRSTTSMKPLAIAAIEAMLLENAKPRVMDGAGEPDNRCHVVSVPPSDAGSGPLAVIICDLHLSKDIDQFRRRSDELSRAFATILSACPDRPLGRSL